MAQATNTATFRAVAEGARVRHFDQLDERTQEFFLATAADRTVPEGRGLERGDVVVFTDYYRVR